MKKQPNYSGIPLFIFGKISNQFLKIFIIGLILNISLIEAAEPQLTEKIELKVSNITLKEALREIENQSTYTFVYNDASIDVDQMVTVDASVISIKELLDIMLEGKGLEYTIVDSQIVITKAKAGQDEKRTITGSVTDSETGEPLPGVSIVEKGTNNGTITNLDGNFTVIVNSNAVITISYVGYISQDISVAGQTEFKVELEPDIISLEDVVVIGYGTVKKSDLTGAVASISAEELQQSAVAGIDQAIQGRTAGVNVITNSGSPGIAPTVRIRGVGTITDPDPLYIVDGMPVSAATIGSLNPGDFESVEILKDASASAIYGSRAANGVVLITTKMGQKGESHVSFDAYTGFQTLAKKYEVMNAEEYITIRNAAGNPWEDSSAVPSTDWQDEIFRKAAISNYQLSFIGGSEKTRYALIGSAFDQKGIIKGTQYTRYSLRVNTATDIKPWLNVGENLNIISSKQHVVPENDEWTSIVISSINMDPATPVYNEDGVPSASQRNNINNPVGMIERNHNLTNTLKLLGNTYVEIKPFKWIKFKTSVGANVSRAENEQFFPVFYESATLNADVNTLYNATYKDNTLLWENVITFQKTFFEKLDVQVMAGYTRQKDTYRLQLASAQGVPEDPRLWYISNSTEIEYADISSEFGIIRPTRPFPYTATQASYLGRAILSYAGRYDLTASIRRDGSSKFGANHKWGNFPSFAAGWKISEEPFFQNVPVVNFLKIRGGWGIIGNQSIGDYEAFTPLTYDHNYTFGEYPNQYTSPGGAPERFGNKDVRWEETEQTNVGLDMNLLENRFSLNFDYFVRNTNDMLARVPIPNYTGIRIEPVVNIGSVRNKGYEINVNYKQTIKDFTFSIGANFSAIRNEVTKLGDDEEPIPSASYRGNFVSSTEVGQPIASFYGYVTDGYWQNWDEIDSANARAQELGMGNYYDNNSTSPGDIRFADLNGDGVVTEEDQTYIGSPHPDFTYGIYIDLSYKIFDLKIFGQGVYGNEIFMANIYYVENPNGYFNMLTTMNDYWREEGDNPSVPRLTLSDENDNLRYSDRYVKDGSYFRIKNIQVGVSLPQSIADLIRVQKLRVYFAAQNLITFHKYMGFDPEIGSGVTRGDDISNNGVLDIGVDRGMYPVARTLSIGVNLTF
ncbi:MAG: TonB-dependent receptor [Bacteroidales bacterium]|nr:TonB-dependent receptor [Bacteroidales bacterium]